MKKKWVSFCRLLSLVPALIIAVSGCAAKKPPQEPIVVAPPVVEQPQFVQHTVKRGETLATIAKWYSGRAGDWRELAQFNPDLKPGNLQVGQIVKVPLHMAVVHKEQPNYSTAPKKSGKASRGTSRSVKEPEPEESAGEPQGESEEVFGPK